MDAASLAGRCGLARHSATDTTRCDKVPDMRRCVLALDSHMYCWHSRQRCVATCCSSHNSQGSPTQAAADEGAGRGGRRAAAIKGIMPKLVGNAATSPPFTSDSCPSLGQVMVCLARAVFCLTQLARHAAQNVWPHDGSMRGRWAASSNGCVQMLHSRREASIASEEEDEEDAGRWRFAEDMLMSQSRVVSELVHVLALT